MDDHNTGLSHLLQYPLFEALYRRRSRRISKGLPAVLAGSLTYKSTTPVLRTEPDTMRASSGDQSG